MMKKYIASFAVITALISTSCSNDDIPVLNATVVKVNPSTVMSNFSYQLNVGDLDGVAEGQELQIDLLIYDKAGSLYDHQTKSVKNYLTTASFELALDNESYTAVAITKIIDNNKDNVKQYWELNDTKYLSKLTVDYTQSGNFVYGDQEVLGLSAVTLKNGSTSTINVEPAGALVLTRLQNIHAYSNVKYIWLRGNRGNGSFAFNSNGSIISNPDLEDEPYFAACNVDETKYTNQYSYKFMMPQTNFIFSIRFGDADRVAFHKFDYNSVNLVKGHEYMFNIVLDPNDDASGDYSYGFTDVTGKIYGRSEGAELESFDNTDSEQTVKSSWKVTELLKQK